MNEGENFGLPAQKPSFNRKYRRLDKPPYTYVAMTTLAIQASAQRSKSSHKILIKNLSRTAFGRNFTKNWEYVPIFPQLYARLEGLNQT